MAVVEIDSREGQPRLPAAPVSGQPIVQRKAAPCQIVHAHADDRLLTWSYTVGLTTLFDHPDFLLTGLDPFLSESLLGRLAHQVSEGRVFSENYLEKNLLQRLTCAFRPVPGSMACTIMPLACVGRNPEAIRVLQCVYPDPQNRLPWRYGYNTSWQDAQPLFTSVLPLSKVAMRLLRSAEGISRQPVQHPVETEL